MTLTLTDKEREDIYFAIILAQSVVIEMDKSSDKPEELADYLLRLDIIKDKLK